MKMSRLSLLLTAVLFFAPVMVIADDATPAQNTEIVTPEVSNVEAVTAEAKGIMAAISAFVLARRANVTDGLDKVAAYSFNPVLRKLASVNCLKGGRFENNIPTINRVLVSAAAAALAYAAYNAYVAQQDANDDFDADFDQDSN